MYQPPCVPLPGWDVERGAGQRQAGNVLGVRHVVLESQDGPPRVAEEVDSVVPQRGPQRIEFAYEVRDGHLRCICHRPRLASTQLIIPDHRPIVAECLERLQVEAVVPGPSVEENHWRAGTRTALPVPDSAISYRQVRLSGPKRRGDRTGWLDLHRRMWRGALGLTARDGEGREGDGKHA